VIVRVTPHKIFGRRGRDITLRVPISFSEAALGSTITVPTLGDPISLKIPPGTRGGKTFRVRGRGLTSGTTTGDLLVTVEVTVPSDLSDEQRTAIEALAAASPASPREHLGV
jgi:molecular chaperone DnaJ